METRQYAHPFDRPVKGDRKESNHGFNLMEWSQYYRDHNTGTLYEVRCSDGTYGGKGPLLPEDDQWTEKCYNAIRERTMAEAEAGAEQIEISTHEWHIMLNRTFCYWLDLTPGEKYITVGDNNRHLNEGQIGTIRGIPVIVNPSKADDLPPR